MVRLRVLAVLILAVALLAPPASAEEQNPALPAVVRGNTWLLRDSLSSGPATNSFRYGRAGDFPLMCDWDGDGERTPGVVRDRPDGRLEWHVRNSNDGGVADEVFVYGIEFDFPICGFWGVNPQGQQTPGIVRARGDERFEWHLRDTLDGGPAHTSFVYGRARFDLPAEPLVGDWDGDGDDTPGLVLGTDRMRWLLRDTNSGGTADHDFHYGRFDVEIDLPIVGDWAGTGDGDRPGVARVRDDGRLRWLLRDTLTSGPADREFTYGRFDLGDFPLVWKAAPAS